MENALVVSGHLQLDGGSVANGTVMDEPAKVDGCEIGRLGALYPDFAIDVEVEQAKLVAADADRAQAACVAKRIEEL